MASLSPEHLPSSPRASASVLRTIAAIGHIEQLTLKTGLGEDGGEEKSIGAAAALALAIRDS